MWVDARPEMRCAVEAGAVDRTRLPCNLSCVMRDAAIASVFIDRIERETKEETCGGPRSSGYTSRGIRKCLDSQFSSTVFYSHLVSTFPKWTAYASVETRGEICLRKNRSRNSETCRPRSSPYVPLSVYYEKYIVTLCSSLSRRREPPGAYPTHLVGWIRTASGKFGSLGFRLFAAWSPKAGLEPDEYTERSDVGRRNWVRCTLVDAAVRLHQVGADVEARC